MRKTYHGSCHCKVVRFTADLDLSQGTGKCNCTFCWKQRMWKAYGQPGDVTVLSGEEALVDYAKVGDGGESHHRFCGRCGIALFGDGDLKENGGPFVAVHLSALDDLPLAELLDAPVRYMDGLNDAWGNPPAETRQL